MTSGNSQLRDVGHGLLGCVTGELVLRSGQSSAYDYERVEFTAEGIEIYPGLAVLFNPTLRFTSFIGGSEYHHQQDEQHSGRWAVPLGRVKTLTYDECAS